MYITQQKFILQVVLIVQVCSPFVSTQILDTSYPIIFTDDFNISSQSPTLSHFGFSVAFVKPSLKFSQGNSFIYPVPQAWLMIGAPKGVSNDRSYPRDERNTGVIWRCSLGAKNGFEDICEILLVDPISNRGVDQCTRATCKDFPEYESKNLSWVGGSMAILNGEGNSGRFVSCAARWNRANKTLMNGLCYSFREDDVNQIGPLEVNKKTFQHRLIPFFEPPRTRKESQIRDNQYFPYDGPNSSNQSKPENAVKWAFGEAGFSFHLSRGENSNRMELVVGAPGVYVWSGAVIRYQDGISDTIKPGNTKRPNSAASNDFNQYIISTRRNPEKKHWNEYFGYAVTTGRFLISPELLYVAGAPRSNDLQGSVIIFQFPQWKGQPIEEKRVLNPPNEEIQTGSYFGSVLLSTKFTGQSNDDLFVAAPLYSKPKDKALEGILITSHMEGDEGCVFLYSSVAEFIGDTPPKLLLGDSQPGARFGSAISSIGDINGDGAEDVAIGAPYQENGVVYIYLGRKWNADDKILQWDDKIEASTLNSYFPLNQRHLQGFGTSISNGLDIDENGTPDIAIGSYESSQVVVLRTRPVIDISPKVTFEILDKVTQKKVGIALLPRVERRFTIRSCVRFRKAFGNPATSIAFKIILTLDPKLQRFSLSIPASTSTSFATKGEVSNFTMEYQQALFIEEQQCVSIDAALVKDYTTDDIPSIRGELKVVQESKIGQRHAPRIRYRRIVYNPRTRKPEIESGNGPGFDDFCRECTYPMQSALSFSLPINSCTKPDCKPELKLDGGFYIEQDGKLSQPLTSFVIGSSKRIVLRLVIRNDGDNAEMPFLLIHWIQRLGFKLSHKPFECPQELQIVPASSQISLPCSLGNKLRSNHNKTIQLVFDVSDLYAYQSSELIYFNVQITTTGSEKAEVAISQQLQLTLVSDFSLKLNLIGSSLKQVYLLNSLFEHFYEVYIEGRSAVASMEMKFKIPFNVTINGRAKRMTRLLRVLEPKESGFTCEIPKEAQPRIEDSGSPSVNLVPPPPSNPLDEPGAPDSDYDEKTGLSNEGIEVDNPTTRRRRDIKDSFELGSNSRAVESTKAEKIVSSPDKDTLLLSCDDETSAYNVKCIEIKCSATNVKPKSVMVMTFGMVLINDTANELLEESSKNSIMLRTHGFAESPDLGISDHDSAQTLIHALPQSLSVATWVYIVAVIVGICLLAVIVLIMQRLGFFRRKAQEQLKELKAEEEVRMSIKRSASMTAAAASQPGQVEATDSTHLVPNEHHISSYTEEELPHETQKTS